MRTDNFTEFRAGPLNIQGCQVVGRIPSMLPEVRTHRLNGDERHD